MNEEKAVVSLAGSSEAIYRDKMYAQYVSSGAAGLDANSTDDFAPRLPFLQDVVRKHFPADRSVRVLDLGCGQGALLHAARLAGYSYLFGVDASGEQVASATRIGIVNVVQGDIFQFLSGQPPDYWDVVVSFDVVEHLTKPEVLCFIDGVRRVLKHGGRWLIHVPNGDSPFVGRILYGDFTHQWAFTRQSVRSLLMAHKFEDVQCFEDAPIVKGVRSLVRFVLWKCIRLLLVGYIAVEAGQFDRSAIFSYNLTAVARKPFGAGQPRSP